MKTGSFCLCGCDEQRLRWSRSADGRPQLRAECTGCGKFLRYQAQTPEALAEAGPLPEPAAGPQQQELFG